MSTKEVCARLNFSHDTLRRRIDAGLIKPLPKLNPALLREPLRFDPADVERLAFPVERLAPGLAASCLSQPRTEG